MDFRKKPRFCVIGAGNGGCAMAAHLSLMGFEVSLYNRSMDRIKPIMDVGGIEMIGNEGSNLPSGWARISLVTTDISEAMDGADIIMVATTANGHRDVAELCAPYLRDGQIVVLNPGRTCGALEFYYILKREGVDADVIVSEAETFIYACRSMNPGQVKIFRIKNAVPVAAIPAYRTPEVVKALRVAFPQFVPGDNVMKTSLGNIGSVFHPAITILNAGRIEGTGGDFEFYMEGVTPSIGKVLEAIDGERVAIGEALGFRIITAREWLYIAYSAAGRTLYEAMRANDGYSGIKAPSSLNYRYINEDVPMSLVPMVSLGTILGVPVSVMRSMIDLASIMNECDYWAIGRRMEKIGLSDMSIKEIRHLVLTGEYPERVLKG
jgi:opine dehydrogenase